MNLGHFFSIEILFLGTHYQVYYRDPDSYDLSVRGILSHKLNTSFASRFLSHLVHSGSSHHIVGKLVGFWSVKSEVKAESPTESAVGSKAGFTAGSEADAEAGSEADAEDSFSAEESFERKFRLFEDLGKLPVVELFDIGGWEEAEFKVSDVLVSQGMAEIKVRAEMGAVHYGRVSLCEKIRPCVR